MAPARIPLQISSRWAISAIVRPKEQVPKHTLARIYESPSDWRRCLIDCFIPVVYQTILLQNQDFDYPDHIRPGIVAPCSDEVEGDIGDGLVVDADDGDLGTTPPGHSALIRRGFQ